VSSNAAACISQGIKIKGEVTGSEDLFVDGHVEGKLSLTNGCLTIGPNGQVKADVTAREVIVRGTVEGKVSGRDKVVLGSTGQVTGEVQTDRLAIEDGAMLRGKVEAGKHPMKTVEAQAAAAASGSPSGGKSSGPHSMSSGTAANWSMSLLNKLGIGIGTGTGREVSRPIPQNGRTRSVVPVPAVGSPRPPDAPGSTRISNGLKELLWNLDGLGRGTLLDLGPAWQTTLSFFIERGFRVSSEDILREWNDFLKEEEVRLQGLSTASETVDMTPTGRAARFLETNLQYPRASFDAVLAWDLLDYLEPALAKQTIAVMTDWLRPGGVVFALFHSKKPEGFQRYRIADSNSLQIISTAVLCPAQKVYQNREIQDLFSRFRTMKSFVSRDQLRETLFIK
jgi:cytoskeletal protein CcmA (bactofilin family)